MTRNTERPPPTGIHHNLPAAWFALRCLVYALTHPPHKDKP